MVTTLARVLAWPAFAVLLAVGLILERLGGPLMETLDRDPFAGPWWCVCQQPGPRATVTAIPAGMRCPSCGREAWAALAFLRGRYAEWTDAEPYGLWQPCVVPVQAGRETVWELRAWQHLPDGAIYEAGRMESA